MLAMLTKGGIIINKYLSDLYTKVQFSDQQIKMFADNIKDKDEVLRVLELIKQNTYHTKNPDAIGITKDEIQRTVKVKSKKLNRSKSKFETATINMTRPMCDIVISYLIGATLIYYDESQGRGKHYHLTSRGAGVYIYLKNEGVIKDEN